MVIYVVSIVVVTVMNPATAVPEMSRQVSSNEWHVRLSSGNQFEGIWFYGDSENHGLSWQGRAISRGRGLLLLSLGVTTLQG
jgi:hypothetical protein